MPDVATEQGRATISRVVGRLVPFIFLCYVVAYIDRVNIGFAKAELQRDLGLSDAAYGLGGGLFFLGYCLFEIPSNLILERVGARVVDCANHDRLGLRVDGDDVRRRAVELLRDAGPPRYRRGRVLSRDGSVPDLLGAGRRARADRSALHDGGARGRPHRRAGVGIPSRRSTATLGLAGWQWLFMVEGLPAVVLGVVALFFLTDRPEQATVAARGAADVAERGDGE